MAGFGGLLRRRKAPASFALASVALLLCSFAFAPEADGQQAPVNFRGARDCFEPIDRTNILALEADLGRVRSVADTCASAAEVQPRRGLAFAYLYAGWANRVLGAGQMAAPPRDSDLSIDSATGLDAAKLSEAARLLEISARMAGVPGADAATRQAGQRARLELSRSYRLLGLINADRFADARRELSALEREGAGDLLSGLAYERAMFILNQFRAGSSDDDAQLLSALQDLSGFANVDPNPRDRYVVERGPAQLARLALYMGDRALNRQPQTLENTQLALRHYRDAVSAYDVVRQLGGGLDQPATARIRVRMGLINLRMASLLGQGQLAEFGCERGADAYAISEAESNFSNARTLDPQSADAHWGLGCALMARGNAPLAVTSFQQAVSLLNAPGPRALTRGDYYLGLARALAMTGQWDGPSGAVANFEAALSGETDSSRISAIRLEIARIYAQNQRWAQARMSLEAAVRAHPDAASYLLLGEILYEHPEYQSAGALSARESLTRAAAIAGPHQPRANYYLSLLEQRAGNGRLAVSYASAAAVGDRANADYRLQACTTRIMFGLTRDQGQAYCSADPANREDYPRGLFYEGLFWLRQAYDSSGGNQRSYWAQALLSFERGGTELGGRTKLIENQSLGRLLAYGRRFALHCAGLGAAIQAEQGDIESEGERRFFTDRFNLGRCWR